MATKDSTGKMERIRAISLEYAKRTIIFPKPKQKTFRTLRPQRKPAVHRKKYDEYIHSLEWSNFRKRIFAERGRKCQRCGVDFGPMEVHHLHYKTLKNEQPQDVLVLCSECHDAEHNKKQHL